MNKKLTLLLDERVISRAKDYADRNHESLSGMVEKYFTFLTERASSKENEADLPAEIEELIGIVEVPKSLDIKKEYRSYRARKGIHE